MASSITYLNSINDSSQQDQDSTPKKRRKITDEAQNHHNQNPDSRARWRMDSEQQIYSSKLVEALRHVRRNPSPVTVKSTAVREVRETADRVLAVVAKGRTRWSRAILASRFNRRLGKHKKVKVNGCNRLKKRGLKVNRRNRIAPVDKKVKVLSRLVPGCRKIPFPNLLEETGDYIKALEMQVRAMATLAQLLNGAPPNRLASTV